MTKPHTHHAIGPYQVERFNPYLVDETTFTLSEVRKARGLHPLGSRPAARHRRKR